MASDTSLVFNILAKENVSRALDAVRSAFTSTGKRAEEALDQATRDTSRLDAEIEKVERELGELNAAFAATADRTLFPKIARDRRLLTQLQQVRRGLDDTNDSARKLDDGGNRAGNAFQRMGSAAGSAFEALSSAGSSVMGLVGNVWGMVAAVGALSVGFSMAGPVAYLFGGALGALPALMAGSAAATNTLRLGFMGLSTEWDKMTKAADAARIGGGADHLNRVADSAKQLLRVLIGLRGAFSDLRVSVQERLFAGMAAKMETLATRWLPQLNRTLGDMAGTFNRLGSRLFDSLSRPTFIRNLSAGVDGVRTALERVGTAASGPLVDAFGRLARASVPFVEMLGDKIGELIETFSGWIADLDDTGELDAFFVRAGEVASDVIDIMEDLASIAGSVISILFKTDNSSESTWDSLVTSVDKLAKWFKDPENQAMIADWIERLGGAIWRVGEIVKTIDEWATKIEGWADRLTQAKEDLGEFFDGLGEKITGFFTNTGDRISRFPTDVGNWLKRLPGVVAGWVGNAISRMGYVIGYGIGSAVRMFASLPGRVFNALVRLPGIVYNAVRAAVSWFGTMGSWAYGAVRNVGAWVSAGLSNLWPKMWNIGQDAVRGLWNGISGMGGWLWGRVANFAANVWAGMKAGLGIASPSKVMADEVGRWIPPGIAAGMDATAGTVMDAAGRISDRLAATTLAAPTVGTPTMAGLSPAGGRSVQVAGLNPAAAGGRQAVQIEFVGDREAVAFLRKLIRVNNLMQTA